MCLAVVLKTGRFMFVFVHIAVEISPFRFAHTHTQTRFTLSLYHHRFVFLNVRFGEDIKKSKTDPES